MPTKPGLYANIHAKAKAKAISTRNKGKGRKVES
jgi:hypothetical protein